jgi:hypothetical protein
MKKLFLVLSFACLLFAAGCLLGDRVGVGNVTLRLSEEGQTTVAVSTNSPDVEDAMRFIDSVLSPEGWRRAKPYNISEEGRIADYAGGPFDCTAYLQDEELTIRFRDVSAHGPSSRMRRTCKMLEEKLGERYGHRRVRCKC